MVKKMKESDIKPLKNIKSEYYDLKKINFLINFQKVRGNIPKKEN